MSTVLGINSALITASVAVIVLALRYRVRGSDGGTAFWISVRLAESLAVTEAVAVAVLYELGHRPHEKLFYLYALLPAAVNLIAEDLQAQALGRVLDRFRVGNAEEIPSLPAAKRRAVTRAALQSQFDVMAIAAVVVVFLALRAISTSTGI